MISTRTEIGDVAVHLLERTFGDELADKSVMGIGASNIAAAQHELQSEVSFENWHKRRKHAAHFFSSAAALGNLKGVIMIASVNPTAIPALTIAGIFFVVVYVVFGVYVWRNRQRFFGPDDRVDGDRKATRYLQVMAICIPLLFITGRVIFELFEIWTQ